MRQAISIKEPLHLMAMARDLVIARLGQRTGVLKIDNPPRLTITLTQTTVEIIRHSTGSIVLLAVWQDGEEPMIVTFVPSHWIMILKRAAQLKPVSILP